MGEAQTTQLFFSGMAACQGRAEGTPSVIRGAITPSKMEGVTDGDILVMKMTTPEVTPILRKIAGIATSEGGVLCHAAIVAREYGIPAVVGCGAGILRETQRKGRKHMEVDGFEGKVMLTRVEDDEGSDEGKKEWELPELEEGMAYCPRCVEAWAAGDEEEMPVALTPCTPDCAPSSGTHYCGSSHGHFFPDGDGE